MTQHAEKLKDKLKREYLCKWCFVKLFDNYIKKIRT